MKKHLVFIICFISSLYFEFIFKIISGFELVLDNLNIILLFAFLFAFTVSTVTSLFKSTARKVIVDLLLLIIGIFFIVQYCLNNIYGFYFQLSTLSLADQAVAFAGDGIKIFLENCPKVLVFFVPFIASFIVLLKVDLRNIRFEYLLIGNLVCFIVYLLVFIYNTDLYQNVSSNISISINKIGVINAFNIDCANYFLGYENSEIVIDEPIVDEDPNEEVIEKVYGYHTLNFDFDSLLNDYADNKQVVEITNYIKNQKGTKENEFTGLFEGKNLIWIMAESFNTVAVSQELTPTLYKLTHSGIQFENYYSPTVVSTIGGEFSQLTSLYADMSSTPTTLSVFRTGNNYFPFGLSTIFEEEGYTTYAYHDNDYNFQDRDKYLAAMGFDNYLGCNNGLEQRINCRIWPESDIEMIDATVNDFINDDKFMVFYAFVSGHGDYSFNENENSISYRYEDLVRNYYGTLSDNETVNNKLLAYVANIIEEDRALEKLINELTLANKMDDTVIVFVPDHHPYYLTQALTTAEYNLLSDYYRDGKFEIYHSNLIIYNPSLQDMDYSKIGCTMDVLPTIYNLFGLDYDSRLMMGKDILSNEFGVIITNDNSWLTNYGTYNSYRDVFTKANEDDEYNEDIIASTNNYVRNSVLMSKYIMLNDYYSILWKYKIEDTNEKEGPIQQ